MLVVLVPLNVGGFWLVLARGWHEVGAPPTASSRSQLAERGACLVAWLACGSVSGVVRRCPPLLGVIVTQLVTHPSSVQRTMTG